MLGSMLLTWHNIQFFQDLMATMRAAIAEDRFPAFQSDFETKYAGGDIERL